MNSQNILKYWSRKISVRLDTSELYDYELGTNALDYDEDVLDITTEINYDGLVIDSSCMSDLDASKPWEIEINKQYTGDTCDFLVRRRTEFGWTLDFVFNREALPWTSGSTFYYWGILDESDSDNYLDNNLSFSFTNDGRIKYEKYHLSGYCHTTSGYTEISYVSTGQTSVLCTGGTSNDFNITMVFKRNYEYTDCDILNEGGSNDYITGRTVTNIRDVMTGATEDVEMYEILNKNWLSNREKRLGTLKIYLNGRLVHQFKDWEEVVPSNRLSENIIAQVFGGGTTGSGDIHTGTTEFNLKQVKYFEEPLSFPRVRHHYLSSIKPNFTINECQAECVESAELFVSAGVLTELDEVLLTEDENVIIY